MMEKKKYITLHYASYLCLFLALLCFFRYLLHRWYVELVCFLVFLITYLVLFRICNRFLQCEGGYSLIQAIYYYQTCKQAGYRGSKKQKDLDVLIGVAERFDFLDHLESDRLKSCYDIGRQAEKSVTNPVVRFLWLLRGKIAEIGGRGNV